MPSHHLHLRLVGVALLLLIVGRVPAAEDPVTVHGEVDRFTLHRNGNGSSERGLLRIQLEDGRSVIVDLGSRQDLQRLDLARGDRVRITGEVRRLDGRRIVRAQRLTVVNDRIAIANHQQTDPAPALDRAEWWDQRMDAAGQGEDGDQDEDGHAARRQAASVPQQDRPRDQQAEVERDRAEWWTEQLEEDDPVAAASAPDQTGEPSAQRRQRSRWEQSRSVQAGGGAQAPASATEDELAGAPLMLQGRVEEIQDLELQGEEGVVQLRLRDGSVQILDLTPWQTEWSFTAAADPGDYVVVRGQEREGAGGRSIVEVDGLVVIEAAPAVPVR
jgi:hypothetical protein